MNGSLLLAYVPFLPLSPVSRSLPLLDGKSIPGCRETGDLSAARLSACPLARFGESIFASFGGYSTFPHTVHVPGITLVRERERESEVEVTLHFIPSYCLMRFTLNHHLTEIFFISCHRLIIREQHGN